MKPAAVRPLFEELRTATSARIAAILADLDITPEQVEDFCCEGFEGELIDAGDYRLPGETEEERWARIIPAKAA